MLIKVGSVNMRLQSAIEYLTTYGWAILIIGIVLGVLFESGLLSPHVATECSFPDFQCLSATISSSGIMNINIAPDDFSYPINITAIGCNSAGVLENMTVITPQITLQPLENFSRSIQCYDNGTAFSSSPGSAYNGYVLVNYTSSNTGFRLLELGKIVLKVE